MSSNTMSYFIFRNEFIINKQITLSSGYFIFRDFNEYINVQPISSIIVPICFSAKVKRRHLSNCYVAGWGHGQTTSELRLKEARIKIIHSKVCQRHFKKSFHPHKQLCAISMARRNTGLPCHGDSGKSSKWPKVDIKAGVTQNNVIS